MQRNKMGRKVIVGSLLACVLMGTAYFLQAQRAPEGGEGTAVIRGTVRSSDGNPLYGILVKARGEGKNYATSVFTDGKGNYEFPPLPLGKYQVTVGTDWKGSVQLSASGASQDFSVKLGLGFMNQTTATSWGRFIPGTEEGKKLVAVTCAVRCHTISRLMYRSPKSPDGWVAIMKKMGSIDAIGRSWIPGDSYSGGLEGSPEELETVKQILVKNYNFKPGLKERYITEAIVRPTGEAARAVFTEWDLPNKRDFVTTATVDSHGNIWYTASMSNAIGRLDPRTGEFREWPLTVPNARPHDTMVDKEDNLWVTLANPAVNRVTKFDTKTYKFTDWTIPGKFGRGAHTGDLDPDGNYWVTLDHHVGETGAVAKIDTRTGSVTEYPSSTKKPHPYGLVVDQKGNVWYTELDANKIGKIDPTGKLTLYTVPTPRGWPRRIHVDSKGKLWFVETYASKLGMLDPVTGKITETDFGIPVAFPYFVKVDKFDKIWFNLINSGFLGRFDPQTKKFVFYLLPTPDGFARDAWFDYSTNPPAIVYGAARMPMVGRMYVR